MTLIRYPLIDNSGPEWDVLDSGIVGTPASGTILLDTGPLSAGLYEVEARSFSTGDANNNFGRVRLEWRNATNTANVYDEVCFVGTGQFPPTSVHLRKVRVQQNQRFRLFVGILGAAQYEGLIRWRRLNGDI